MVRTTNMILLIGLDTAAGFRCVPCGTSSQAAAAEKAAGGSWAASGWPVDLVNWSPAGPLSPVSLPSLEEDLFGSDESEESLEEAEELLRSFADSGFLVSGVEGSIENPIFVD